MNYIRLAIAAILASAGIAATQATPTLLHDAGSSDAVGYRASALHESRISAMAIDDGRIAHNHDAQTPPLKLVKVVMLTRHGIRSGTKSPAFLARYSKRVWPRWPVAPGQLTRHGAKAINHLGGWLRMHYAQEGLLAATGCPASGTATVWADNADKRTRESGQAVLDGMFPGCGMQAYWRPLGHDDPLFHGVPSNPMDPTTAMKAVRQHGDPNAPGPGYQQAMRHLERIFGIEKDCKTEAPACAWARKPNRLVVKSDGDISLEGPLHVGSTLSEILLLEYVQGLPHDQGVISAAQLGEVIPLHAMYSRLMRGTPYLAAHNAHALTKKIVRALHPSSTPDKDNPAPATKLLLFLGHDTNLTNLGTLLGNIWSLPDQADPTAPNTTLAFELLRDGAGHRYVRVRVYYQTLAQLRGAQVLDAGNPAHAVTLTLPACANGHAEKICSLKQFSKLLEHGSVPVDDGVHHDKAPAHVDASATTE